MKYTLLASALLTILSSSLYADTAKTAPTTSAPAPGPKAAASAPANPVLEPGPVVPPADLSSIPAPVAPAATLPTNNCDSPHFPANTTAIDSAVILPWAGKAVVKAFEFNPATIDTQLSALKACFTDQGWQGFNDALQKSGNINAIKSQLLNVSSQMDGEPTLTSSKDNQWKVTIPLQVVYQNSKEKLTQLLSVDLLIGRKITGDLGIMQMIATPRPEQGNAQPVPATTPVKTPAAGPAKAAVLNPEAPIGGTPTTLPTEGTPSNTAAPSGAAPKQNAPKPASTPQ